MRVTAFHQLWQVEDERSLEAVLAWRDDRGGGLFLLTHDEQEHPSLAVRISGTVADVMYFPHERHPGFRCIGGQGRPEGGVTNLVYRGCDPASGEQEPNEFIVPFETACAVAGEFLRSRRLPESVAWLEL